MAERAYREVYLEGRNTLASFAEQLLAEPVKQARRVSVPFALARRLPTPALPDAIARPGSLPSRGRRRISLVLTLLDGLAREPEARRLLLRAARAQGGLPVRDAARDIVLLRVLARIRQDSGRRERWWLSAENAAGTITIETHAGTPSGRRVQLDKPFETVVWKHSAVAKAAPLFPHHPYWGWIAVGTGGRYEFKSLGAARTDDAGARALLERTLEPRKEAINPD